MFPRCFKCQFNFPLSGCLYYPCPYDDPDNLPYFPSLEVPMFVIKLDDSSSYPAAYFVGFSRDSLCPVRYGPLEEAHRFDDLGEAIKFQNAIYDMLPKSKWIIAYGG